MVGIWRTCNKVRVICFFVWQKVKYLSFENIYEYGYVINPDEYRKISTKEYVHVQKKLANVWKNKFYGEYIARGAWRICARKEKSKFSKRLEIEFFLYFIGEKKFAMRFFGNSEENITLFDAVRFFWENLRKIWYYCLKHNKLSSASSNPGNYLARILWKIIFLTNQG